MFSYIYLLSGTKGVNTMEEQPKSYAEHSRDDQINILVDKLKQTINEFAVANTESGRLDLFDVYAALGRTAFEVAYTGMTANNPELNKIVLEQTPVIVKGMQDFMTTIKGLSPVTGASEVVALAQHLAHVGMVYGIESKRIQEEVLKKEETPTGE